jgi:hypothetical protein
VNLYIPLSGPVDVFGIETVYVKPDGDKLVSRDDKVVFKSSLSYFFPPLFKC